MLATIRRLLRRATAALTGAVKALRRNPAALAIVAAACSLALLAWLEP